ncbi:deoxyribonuclease I [Enterococcus ureilyticus]|uniref:endonuclease III domain-containing protein n=1 Tax=Enterococcus ureilyticus TaxID=1131292 RepID=UPI001A92F41E|nr:deoxyribonuclease I [Enterococcus ureilyticus]MBO0447283.1 deoxyribonuclease I [Enterococcus ureilyticus]
MITNIEELYQTLSEAMDHSIWWNTENPWEIVIGSILVQNTSWKNVDYSLINIRNEIGFIPKKLAEIDLLVLQDLIRPSGFYKNKSQTLKEVFVWFRSYDYNIATLQEKDLTVLREELLNIQGIGHETADVLLVFVFKKVVFIADKYAQRIFNHLGLEEALTYLKLQSLIELSSDFTNQQAQNLHGWLVDYGQVYLKSEEIWQTGFLSNFKLVLA